MGIFNFFRSRVRGGNSDQEQAKFTERLKSLKHDKQSAHTSEAQSKLFSTMRREKKLTQEEAAKALGISQSHYSAIETGRFKLKLRSFVLYYGLLSSIE